MSAEPGRSVVKLRWSHVLVLVVIACAVIGYFVGIDDGVPRPEAPRPEPRVSAEGDAPPAASYEDVGAFGPELYSGPRHTVRDLAAVPFDLSKETESDTTGKVSSLSERGELRAFNGAPPTIPHDVEQMASASCLSCHGLALRVGDLGAPLIPHEPYANCQQCHVAESPLFRWAPMAASSFEGAPVPNEGARAWTGAPPVVPHSTWMRENCLSCHGPTGKPGLRTSHPGRSSCLQCHGGSAELDRFASTTAARLAPLPPSAPPTDTEETGE